MKLIIGNKRYSSWSLRPWLVAKHFGIPFEEILIGLDQTKTAEQIAKYSPSGKVPALIDGNMIVWDSLAICEYLNDKFPEKRMWPQDLKKRAWARAVSAEMHSGFQTMREKLSHDIQKQLRDFDWTVAANDIKRVKQIWTECMQKFGGPFLFGEFSIADAMYAPVCNRFVTYGVPMEKEVAAYVERNRALPAHKEWINAALVEDLRVPRYE